jgi:hypothetical protein
MTRISDMQAHAIFGNPAPPLQVTEYQFDGFDDELRELAQTPLDKIQDGDLWYYLHDLAYVELQPDLFTYLFPVCLNFWYHTLLRNVGCAVGDAEFHYALFRGEILEKYVTPDQRNQIFTFFHDGFLDCLDEQRGFIYQDVQPPASGWISRFNSLGLVTTLTEPIWNSWWSMDSCGQAVSALIYLSGLMYGRGENPIFKPWAKKYGGLYVWENDSYIFDHGWLPANLDFFRRTLTVDYLGQKAREASQRLANEPEAEMANKIYEDYEQLAEDVEIRIEYLLERLAAINVVYFDW